MGSCRLVCVKAGLFGGHRGTRNRNRSRTARLNEAIAAFREALTETARERVPLDWAKTQTNLGTALARLGERESGTARLLGAAMVTLRPQFLDLALFTTTDVPATPVRGTKTGCQFGPPRCPYQPYGLD
jgi:hypothetical protein